MPATHCCKRNPDLFYHRLSYQSNSSPATPVVPEMIIQELASCRKLYSLGSKNYIMHVLLEGASVSCSNMALLRECSVCIQKQGHESSRSSRTLHAVPLDRDISSLQLPFLVDMIYSANIQAVPRTL